MAAVLAAGTGACLSHDTASELHGLWTARSHTIHVLSERRVRGGPRITMHTSTTLVPEDIVMVGDLPVTSVSRTLLDVARTCSVYRIVRMISEAAFHGTYDREAVHDLLVRNVGRPREVAMLRRAQALYEDGSCGSRSLLEEQALWGIARAGLSEPLLNHHVEVVDGTIEVDLLWPQHMLVVEVDGPGHTRPSARRRDARRDSLLVDAGYTVLRVTHDQIPRIAEIVTPHLGCG